jgi:GWxTD domain-containing protein
MQFRPSCFRSRSLFVLVSAASHFFLPGNSLSGLRQENFWEATTSEKQYFVTLAAADSLAFQREFENPFVLLLDAEQKEEYFKLHSPEKRKAFMRAYWKSHNPDPLLPENDWLLDFIRRCSYVTENFPSPQPPYFDDRGKYYLRYGKPWYRYQRHYQYNLLPNEYEIAYRVMTVKSRKGLVKKLSQWLSGAKDAAVSVTFTRPVVDDTAPELIAIDLKNVPNGAYLVEIKITATANRAITAAAQKEITIVE